MQNQVEFVSYVCGEIVEPVYSDIGLYDTSPITSDILWYQLIPRC